MSEPPTTSPSSSNATSGSTGTSFTIVSIAAMKAM